MNKYFIPFFQGAFLLILSLNSYSQFFIKTGLDSVTMETDSVILTIQKKTGTVDWEVSRDSATWESLNNPGDSLEIRIESNAWYRAVLTVGNCDPVSSEITRTGFKSIEVPGKYIEIDSTGGVYFFPSGIKMIVPAGAVRETTFLTCDLLDEDQADFKMPMETDSVQLFCTALNFEPSGTVFLKPVRFRIPAGNYQHTDLPHINLYHFLTNSWEKYSGSFLCSEGEKFIEFSLDRVRSARIMLDKNFFEFDQSGKKSLPEDSCRLRLIKIITSSEENVNSEGCFFARDVNKVVFLSCPGQPEESASGREIGIDCNPVVKHTISTRCLKKGETAQVDLTATIVGLPLDSTIVRIGNVVGLSMSTYQTTTDESGRAHFSVFCYEDDFEGSFYFKVECEYFLQEFTAQAGGKSEVYQREKVFKPVTVTEHINCRIPELTSAFLSGGDVGMFKNETSQLTLKCYDQFSNPINPGNISYSILSSYPNDGVISLDENGIVSAVGPGIAMVKALADNVESNEISFSVAFEGDLRMEKITDHSAVQLCGCKEEADATGHWSWYLLSYTGVQKIHFWLKNDHAKPPTGKLIGYNLIRYTIESAYCKDTTISEEVNSSGMDVGLTGSSITTTQDILSGVAFDLFFNYFDWRGRHFPNALPLECRMVNEVIQVMVGSQYEPEYCVGKWIVGTCILH